MIRSYERSRPQGSLASKQRKCLPGERSGLLKAPVRSASFAAVLILLTLPAMRVSAAVVWRSIDTIHYTIRYHEGMEGLGYLAADLLEESYRRASDVLYHDMTRAITVDVWPASHRMPYAAGSSSPPSLLAGIMHLNICYPGSVPAFRRLLMKHVTRAFIYDMLADERFPVPAIRSRALPGWFTESLTMYLSDMEPPRESGNRPAYLNHALPGMTALTGDPGVPSADDMPCGSGLAGFIHASFGRSSLGEIILDVRDTGSFDRAITITTGKDLPVLMSDTCAYFARDINQRFDHGTLGFDLPPGTDRRPYAMFPAVSPDGAMIAYLAAGTGSPELRIVSMDTGQRGRTPHAVKESKQSLPGTGGSVFPSDNRITWTGDGLRLMVAGRYKGSEAILFIDRKTGAIETALRLPFSTLMFPSLSGDEKYLVFTGIGAVSADIYIYERMTGLLTRITDDPFMDRDPILSPDGKSVLFSTNWNAGGDPSRQSYDIIRQDLRTGNRQVLVRNGSINIQPSLSPDGGRLLYISNERGPFAVYSRDPVSDTAMVVSDPGEGALFPSWAPSGKAIVYICRTLNGSVIQYRELGPGHR